MRPDIPGSGGSGWGGRQPAPPWLMPGQPGTGADPGFGTQGPGTPAMPGTHGYPGPSSPSSPSSHPAPPGQPGPSGLPGPAVFPGPSGLPEPPGPPGPPGLPPSGYAGGRRRRRRLRDRAGPLLALLAIALAGLAGGVLGISSQLMPRTFSPAQRQQIMAWEVAKRWRTWTAGQIFPAAAGYKLPGSAFGAGKGISLTAHRVGIARQAACHSAASGTKAAVLLARHGCQAVLRATYDDATKTLAVTVGVAVLPSAGSARAASMAMANIADGLRAEPFRRTPVARFGRAGGLLPWHVQAGPYLVLATVGYADGRPWLAGSDDSYAQTEMMALASGVGQFVASRLGAAPAPPRCPGSPGC
jgi:hypothetical protein